MQNGNVPNGPVAITKHSMLDKLKLFNKEKSDRSSKTHVSKRTSSSSGFSSARSERSDSSLSLNDGQSQQTGGKLFSTSKKADSASGGKIKTKLLSVSKGNPAKETIMTAKCKTDRKDKSPARNECLDTKTVPPKLQKISATKQPEQKTKVSCGSKKLEVRSESRNSLSHIQQPKAIVQPPIVVNTGIPKPTAFIKGTTKPTHQHKIDHVDMKPEKIGDISTNISNHEAKMQFAVPMAMDSSGGGVINPNTFHHIHHHQQQLLNQNISMTDSSHSKSTHSSSNGLHSNSSESSVIYRPSSESGSDALYIKSVGLAASPNKNVIPNRKIDNFAQPMVVPATCHKFNTVPSKMLHANGIIFEEEKQMTVMPMRPLLRGYNSHVTLPTRGTRGQHLVSEYCEDIGQGYCSDGDALRKIPIRYADIDNGYMSEGSGAGIHAKHVISVMRGRTQLPTTIEER